MLVAGVGYQYLRDWSVGPHVAARLREREWPPGVEMDDWSFGPVDAAWKLHDADPPYRRVVFFGAVDRGRPPGTVVRRRWDAAELPSTEEIQARVAEAVTGVISIDNLVIVCGALGALPDDVVVIEVQPLEESWGDGFSAPLTAAIPELVDRIEAEVAAAAAAVVGRGHR